MAHQTAKIDMWCNIVILNVDDALIAIFVWQKKKDFRNLIIIIINFGSRMRVCLSVWVGVHQASGIWPLLFLLLLFFVSSTAAFRHTRPFFEGVRRIYKREFIEWWHFVVPLLFFLRTCNYYDNYYHFWFGVIFRQHDRDKCASLRAAYAIYSFFLLTNKYVYSLNSNVSSVRLVHIAHNIYMLAGRRGPSTLQLVPASQNQVGLTVNFAHIIL